MSGTWGSAIIVVLFFVASVQGQTTAANQKAYQLYSQATELHQAQKHQEALVKIKAALVLVPRSRTYLAYKAQLEALAKQDTLDGAALQASSEAESSVDRLANQLTKAAKADREKARLIYRWVTDRIAYDVQGTMATDVPVDEVLKKRLAPCEGYADLFVKLAKQAGLEAVKIPGLCKGDGYVSGSMLDEKNASHTWNAVKIGDQWQLVDCTWGAGFIQDKKFVKTYRDYFFLTPPEQFVFTHFPADSKWQLLTPVVTREEFLQWPKIELPLFQFGWKIEDVRKQLKKDPSRGIVQAGDPIPMRLTFRAAPLEGKLKAGTRYKFHAEAAGIAEMAFLMGGKAIKLKRKDTIFEGEVVARKGKLAVGVRPPHGKSQFFHFVLEYEVE